MSDENFRTLVPVAPFERLITYRDRVLFMGSCFAEEIGQRLVDYKFRAMVNPFGIVFNPQSLLTNLQRVVQGQPYQAGELVQHQDQWISFDHHGRFSHPNRDVALERINTSLEQARGLLKGECFLFITLGTAWAYHHVEQHRVVANCHRIPQQAFQKKLLDLDALVKGYETVLTDLFDRLPKLQVVFTVSPVRHWKDGPIQNQRSKSLLHLLCQRLEQRFERCGYFPAYEIVMDDLRDYRFYDRDLLHLSAPAIDYVWKRFGEGFLDASNAPVFKAIDKVRFALQHRTDDPESRSYQRFVVKHLDLIKELMDKYHFLNLEEEYQAFKNLQL